MLFLCPPPPSLPAYTCSLHGLTHCQPRTCTTLTCIPMTRFCTTPPSPPPTASLHIAFCAVLSSDSSEHHGRAHFSPDGKRGLHLISPLCQLLKSAAGRRDYQKDYKKTHRPNLARDHSIASATPAPPNERPRQRSEPRRDWPIFLGGGKLAINEVPRSHQAWLY